MRRISYISIVSLLAFAVVFASTAPVKAETKTVYIFNTAFTTNKGLGFCEPISLNGCIESISIDGNQLTQGMSQFTSDYTIAGGLYSIPCRFLDTQATTCEAPYMVIYPRGGPTPTPTGSQVIGEVSINFRRKVGDEPTARLGAMISSGLVKSFTPAAPGIRDVADVVVSPILTQEYQASGGASCSGWVPTIDLCTIGDKATFSYSNKVVLMLLPGFRNSVVPSDEVVSNCTVDLANSCIVNVFDPMSLGGWMDTDASIFGTASTDRVTGAAQLKIAGPHFKFQAGQIVETRTPGTCPYIKSICDGSPPDQVWPETITTVIKNLEPILNLSTFRAYMPSGYLMNAYVARTHSQKRGKDFVDCIDQGCWPASGKQTVEIYDSAKQNRRRHEIRHFFCFHKKEGIDFSNQVQANQEDICNTYVASASWLALLNTGIYG
jgi:hypothetical protein